MVQVTHALHGRLFVFPEPAENQLLQASTYGAAGVGDIEM
jgi:hypothetical protein